MSTITVKTSTVIEKANLTIFRIEESRKNRKEELVSNYISETKKCFKYRLFGFLGIDGPISYISREEAERKLSNPRGFDNPRGSFDFTHIDSLYKNQYDLVSKLLKAAEANISDTMHITIEEYGMIG